MIGDCLINPSLMCMDFLEIRSQIAFLNEHADYLHVDIMDGHFVPNITLSPDFCGRISPISNLPLDCHLMVTDPLQYLEPLRKAGAGFFVPHAETLTNRAFSLFEKVQKAGLRCGAAISPETPIEAILPYADLLEKITVMTVDPGFSGAKFIPQTLEKIEKARGYKAQKGFRYQIEVDGACNRANYKAMYGAGARVFVMGSTGLFGLDKSLDGAWRKMEEELLSAIEQK